MLCKGCWRTLENCDCKNAYDDFQDKQNHLVSTSEVGLKEHMRMLWEEYIIWTRLTIISVSATLPDLDLTIERLRYNAKDFEMTFSFLYGDETAQAVGCMMGNHLASAIELIKTVRVGNRKAALAAEHAWYENVDKMAAFLANINPNWSEERVRTMLCEHLKMTESEIIAIFTGEHGRGIETFDSIEKQILKLADELTEGITKQFPDKFPKHIE